MSAKKLFCLDCKHSKVFQDDELSKLLNVTHLEKSICRLFGKVICEKCRSSNLTLSSNETGVVYFDSRNLKLCNVCNFPISLRRLHIQPYATTCVLCNAGETEELNESPEINNCPDCSSKLYFFRDLSKNLEYINCLNYSTKQNNKCGWRILSFSKNEFAKYEKKVLEQLRSLRVKIAIEEETFLDCVYSEDDMQELKNMAFLKAQHFDSKFSKNLYLSKHKSLILNIINQATKEFLLIY